MSAPVRGRRPSRFTFNIPSPAHAKQPQQQHTKYPQHPAPPPSFLIRKQDTARRRQVSTPHPINTHKPAATPHPLVQHKTASFVDYSLSLQFSPSFSPSSCVISGVPLPDTPTSPTDSPVSDMRQRRWSAEMRRDSNDDNEEQEEEEEEEGEEQDMMSPNILSSSSCSLFSPLDSASSLDTPITSPPASSSFTTPLPHIPTLPPHRRIHSDPLPAPSTSSASSITHTLNLRPLVIPPSKDGDAIVMLSAMSPVPLSQLTDRQCSYECDEQSSSVGVKGVDELLYSRPMTLAECWYGRSEWMSPVNGAAMMYMAAQQQNSSHHTLPFTHFRCDTTAAI